MQPSLQSILEHFHHPQKKLYLLAVTPNFHSILPALGNYQCSFCLYRFTYPGRSIWMESYNMWSSVTILFPLSIIFSSFIHVETYVSTSFLFMDESYSIIWIYYVLFIHSLVDKHLVCFHFLVIMNNAAMNTLHKFLCGQMFLLDIYLGVELLGHMAIICWTARLFCKVVAPLKYFYCKVCFIRY